MGGCQALALNPQPHDPAESAENTQAWLTPEQGKHFLPLPRTQGSPTETFPRRGHWDVSVCGRPGSHPLSQEPGLSLPFQPCSQPSPSAKGMQGLELCLQKGPSLVITPAGALGSASLKFIFQSSDKNHIRWDKMYKKAWGA